MPSRHPRKTVPRHIIAVVTLIAALAPFAVTTEGTLEARTQPYEQEFVITAYYSPEEDQCCYVLGGEEADKILNGQGTHGADGTPVYPGMVAAPPEFAFGTRIALPFGTVTVHDRGGAIQVLEGGIVRLDLYMGSGEKALAQALAFGVQRVRGTVYPVGSAQREEQWSFDAFAAPLDRLKPFLTADWGLLTLHPQKGEFSLSVVLLQENLKQLGYFPGQATGFFGDETQAALAALISAMRLQEPSDHLSAKTAAYLVAALRRKNADPDIALIHEGSSPADVQSAQRLLRFLGFYEGRTDGMYDDDLKAAILAFQQKHLLVGTAQDPGAGHIGPITLGKLEEDYERRLIASIAQRYLLMQKVHSVLDQRGQLPDRFLREGMNGAYVRQLQQFLADRHYFPHDEINGNFGPLTKDAIVRYQVDKGLVKAGDADAGYVGAATLKSLRSEKLTEVYRQVRGHGLGML